MGTTFSAAMFSKGDNFHDVLFAYLRAKFFLDVLFAYLKGQILPKWGLLLKERICSDRSKFFPL